MTTSRGSGRALALVNALVVAAVVFWNYWTAVNGFGGNTVGGMSDEYDTLFTPASYAFSIWGLIFFGLVVNAGYQLWLAFRAETTRSADEALAGHRDTYFTRLGPWLILTNVANALWTVLWLSEQTAASVVVLACMVAFLTVAMRRLEMETWDAPLEVLAFVWWPIVTYAGWVTVAVLANLSAFLAKHGWVSGDSELWALAMIGLAMAANVALVLRQNLREHALVAIWAFVAIAARQWGRVGSVQWGATAAAALLGLLVFAHAYQRRRTLPIVRRFYGASKAEAS